MKGQFTGTALERVASMQPIGADHHWDKSRDIPMPGNDDMNFLSPKPKRASTCLYIVLQSRGAWWVDREGRSLGPYATRDEAESGAFHLIEVFGDPTRPAEVWSRDDAGKIRLIWKGDFKA